MIILQEASKILRKTQAVEWVLRPTTARIPSNGRIALFGTSETHKRTLLDLFAGLSKPSAGRIVRHAEVSFPPGSLGSFSMDLPLYNNISHAASVYGVNAKDVLACMASVLGSRRALEQPLKEFPMESLRALSALISLALPFDTYLLSDDVLRGDTVLKARCRSLLSTRLWTSGAIISTRSASIASQFCNLALVLHDGELTFFDDVRQAYSELKDLELTLPRRAKRDTLEKGHEEDLLDREPSPVDEI